VKETLPQHGPEQPALVQVQRVSKVYEEETARRAVLDEVNLEIQPGELLVLLGASGSGKTTLLNLISGIDRPTSGRILVNDVDITALSERDRTLFRRDYIGMVFQFFNLVPTLTVMENVTLPHDLRGTDEHVSRPKALAWLERVGLAHRSNAYPDTLSGGEQQRVAIARALMHEPLLVLADEPTGNLDLATGRKVLALLLEVTREAGKTLVLATHNPEIAAQADRVCRVGGGKLVVSVPSGAAGTSRFS
jgi:putative ABC transport system ATP-binding protein